MFEDDCYEFKYIRQIVSEQDKNHRDGTNVRCNGVIPVMTIYGSFNPGEYLEFYMSFLPLEATKINSEGGWLFPRARKHGVGAYNIHNPKEMKLFEPNMKGNLSNDNFFFKCIFF